MTVEETTLLIALLFKRSDKKRARLSNMTFKSISKQTKIRSNFLNLVISNLADIGITLIELERGGFGLFYSSILEGAPSITTKLFKENEQFDFTELQKQFEEEFTYDENEE